jgi:hypothetical protein
MDSDKKATTATTPKGKTTPSVNRKKSNGTTLSTLKKSPTGNGSHAKKDSSANAAPAGASGSNVANGTATAATQKAKPATKTNGKSAKAASPKDGGGLSAKKVVEKKRKSPTAATSTADEKHKKKATQSVPSTSTSTSKDAGEGQKTKSKSSTSSITSTTSKKRKSLQQAKMAKNKQRNSNGFLLAKPVRPGNHNATSVMATSLSLATNGNITSDYSFYQVTLPGSVKKGNTIQVKLGTGAVADVICPDDLPSAKYNQRRTLLLRLPCAKHGSKANGNRESSSSSDEEVEEASPAAVASKDVDVYFQWKELESSSEDDDGSSENESDTEGASHGDDKAVYAAAKAAMTPQAPADDDDSSDDETTSSATVQTSDAEGFKAKKEEKTIKTPSSKTQSSPKKASTPSSFKLMSITKASSYVDLAHDAIVKMKDRSGSSHPTILKFLYATHGNIMIAKTTTKKQNPAQVRQHLLNALKTGVKAGRFMRVRNSFKINMEWLKKQKAQASAAKAKQLTEKRKREKEKKKLQEKEKREKQKEEEKKKKALEVNISPPKKKVQATLDQFEKVLTEEDRQKLAVKRAEAELRQKRKEEAQRLEKLRLEKVRRRKLPMDDLQLIESDKELKVQNPPEGISSRPKSFPLAFNYTKTADAQASDVENDDPLWSTAHFRPVGVALSANSVQNMLQTYHVLFGDLGLCQLWNKHRSQEADSTTIFCPSNITMMQLACSLAELDRGNSFRAKCLPPLLCHTITTLLQMLLDAQDGLPGDENEEMEEGGDYDDDEQNGNNPILTRREDFEKLANALTPASCGEILKQYLQVMQRVSNHLYVKGEQQYSDDYFRDEESDVEEKNDMDESDDKKDKIEIMETDSHGHEADEETEDVYVGDPTSKLNDVFDKLCYSQSDGELDLWYLSSNEMICVIRTLCEDVLLRKSDMIAAELQHRSDSLAELSDTKRLSNREYREARLAYEGPKNRKRASTIKGKDTENKENKGKETENKGKETENKESKGKETENKESKGKETENKGKETENKESKGKETENNENKQQAGDETNQETTNESSEGNEEKQEEPEIKEYVPTISQTEFVSILFPVMLLTICL